MWTHLLTGFALLNLLSLTGGSAKGIPHQRSTSLPVTVLCRMPLTRPLFVSTTKSLLISASMVEESKRKLVAHNTPNGFISRHKKILRVSSAAKRRIRCCHKEGLYRVTNGLLLGNGTSLVKGNNSNRGKVFHSRFTAAGDHTRQFGLPLSELKSYCSEIVFDSPRLTTKSLEEDWLTVQQRVICGLFFVGLFARWHHLTVQQLQR